MRRYREARPQTAALLGVLFGGMCGSTLQAQSDDAIRVELRVSSVLPTGVVTVDRGKRDGLAQGDTVTFRPRAGGTFRGRVVRLDERTADVEMVERGFTPPAGTRGEVEVPSARLAAKPAPQPVPQQQPTPPAGQGEPNQPAQPPEHPPWRNRDEGFTPDKPLLAQVKPIRPQERQPSYGGRWFTTADLNYSDAAGSSNSYGRAGLVSWLDNPFGRGGALRFDGEFAHRTEVNDQRGTDLVVRELSYLEGGNRFDSERVQVGRFLQSELPQLGLLDGVAYSKRRDNGHRYGGSVGFLPELDDDMHSGEDLQFAAFYRYVDDERERLTATAGFQKTLNRGRMDRDLFVFDVRNLRDGGWDLQASAWLDLYLGRDDAKNQALEVTQAFASASRRFDSGSGFDLTLRRLRFPQQLRKTYPQLPPQELTDNRYDRIAFTWWLMVDKTQRLHGQVAGYGDEDGDGASAELGIDVQDWLGARSRVDVTAFGSAGDFGSQLGARVTYGRATDNGRWDALYEVSNFHYNGFTAERDDLLQHRVFGSRSFALDAAWFLTLQGGAQLFDSDTAWSAGFYLQRSF